MDEIAERLARNVSQLRTARGLTHAQAAKLAGLPRATWTNLESGAANPTLAVLQKVAVALQVSLEELVAPPRGELRRHPRDTLPVRLRGPARIRKLIPDPLPGIDVDRMELAPKGRMTGVPHTPGTREYLTCESGAIELVVAGTTLRLDPGDVVSFRGDQRHSYVNPLERPAVGYSVVVLAPAT